MLGKRVEEHGLIEVLVEAYVIWGLHNTPCWVDKVDAGFLFNSLDMVGSWHDVLSIKEIKEPFKLVGPAIPAIELKRQNRKNKIKIKRIAYSGKSWNRWLEKIDFGRKL